MRQPSAYGVIVMAFAFVVLILSLAVGQWDTAPKRRTRKNPAAPLGSAFASLPGAGTPSQPWAADGLTREERWRRDHPEEVDLLTDLACRLRIYYRDRFGNEGRRTIVVHALVGSPDESGIMRATTVRSFCERKQGIRSFSLTGILEAVDVESRENITDVAEHLRNLAAQPKQKPRPRPATARDAILEETAAGMADRQAYWSAAARYPALFPEEYLDGSHGPKLKVPRNPAKKVASPRKPVPVIENADVPMHIRYDEAFGEERDRDIIVRRILGRPMPDGRMKVDSISAYCSVQKRTRSFSPNRFVAAREPGSGLAIADVAWYVWKKAAADRNVVGVPPHAPGDPIAEQGAMPWHVWSSALAYATARGTLATDDEGGT